MSNPITVTLTVANAAALGQLAAALGNLGSLVSAASMSAGVSASPSAATVQTAAPVATPVAATPAASASFHQPPAAVDLNTLGALLQAKAQSNSAGFAALMQKYGMTSMQSVAAATDKWAALHAEALAL